ncbi:ammonium transporter [Okeania sp. KiyG1]|uniref:ammonium transporter n=1 Tax=Okeania sp. KiyG1 TaxID=2720165 RepID=UPI0019209704|nr:ammonium transporter [Okeania sp. KiyG1]GGA39105.1 ammonium transporter [Okeania sp. KiyG1]
MRSKLINEMKDKNWFSRFRYLCLFLATIVVLISGQRALANGVDSANSFAAVDNIWLLLAGALVFFMNAGFALLEAGLCRKNNSINVLAKNLIVFCVAAIAFWFFGFGLMFGDNQYHSCGENVNQNEQKIVTYWGHFSPGTEYNESEQKSQFILLPKKDNPLGFPEEGFSCLQSEWKNRSIASLFFFQLAFAATAATIVSGAVAERISFWAFFWFSFILVGFLYPITGHWVWSKYGVLRQALNFKDFAGSTVVHTVGGTAALAGAILLKPRWNRFGYDPHEDLDRSVAREKLPSEFEQQNYFTYPSDLTSATLGCFILWLGWLGFNGGSARELQDVGHIIIVTIMSAATGGIVAILSTPITALWSQTFEKNPETGKPELLSLINGILGGLVGVTASSAYIDVPIAILIGAVSGFIVTLGSLLLRLWKIDDPVGAIPVHLFCGCWGTLAVSLSLQGTEVYQKNDNVLRQLGNQILGWLIVFTVVFVLSWIVWVIIGGILYSFDMIIGNSRELSKKGNFLAKVHRIARQGIRVTPEQEKEGSDGFWVNPKNPKNPRDE